MAGSSGAAASKRAKNKQMASHLKDLKIERETGVCPICYKTVHIGRPQQTAFDTGMFGHISAHARGNV